MGNERETRGYCNLGVWVYSQTSLSLILLSSFLQIPGHLAKPLATAHELLWMLPSVPLFSCEEWSEYTAGSSIPRAMSFKAGPVGYSNATVVPYCVMIAYCTEQPVNQALIFPPQSTGQGNFL